MIMLFNQLLDMSDLSGGWICLGKGEMLNNRDINKHFREIRFLCIMEHFWDLLFQLIKNATNT
jgi:hypothetical protein